MSATSERRTRISQPTGQRQIIPICAPGDARLVHEVINAAYSAFYAGLHSALYVSAGLVFAAGLFTVLWFGSHQQGDKPASRIRFSRVGQGHEATAADWLRDHRTASGT
jgi:hypothetical protein